MNSAGLLVTSADYCSEKDNLFCYDIQSMIIRKQAKGGAKIVGSSDDDKILAMTDNSKKNRWRFRRNGRLRLVENNTNECWERECEGGMVTISLKTCSDQETLTEANNQQFHFQILTGNYFSKQQMGFQSYDVM